MNTAAHLHREIVGTEAEVISATKRRKLGAHVHLQMLEEVMILKTDEMETISKCSNLFQANTQARTKYLQIHQVLHLITESCIIHVIVPIWLVKS